MGGTFARTARGSSAIDVVQVHEHDHRRGRYARVAVDESVVLGEVEQVPSAPSTSATTGPTRKTKPISVWGIRST